MLSKEYKEAFVEVLEILKNTDEDLVKKIPKKLVVFFEENKSSDYVPNFDYDKTLLQMDLKAKTKSIISVIYIHYFCNKEEKMEIDKILQENQEKYQEMINEKYNPDNLFKKHDTNNKNDITNQIVEYKKKGILERFFDMIKRIFKK